MAARFAGNPRIKICSPEELEKRPDGSLDLIVANSVVQYLHRPSSSACSRCGGVCSRPAGR